MQAGRQVAGQARVLMQLGRWTRGLAGSWANGKDPSCPACWENQKIDRHEAGRAGRQAGGWATGRRARIIWGFWA